MRRLILTKVMLLVAATMMATPVSHPDAEQVAQAFWSGTLHARNAEMMEWQPFSYQNVYLFTMPKGGWILVSADDCARPVLAFSASGTFNPKQMPIAMQNILFVYEQEIFAARETDDLPRDKEWDILLGGGVLEGTEENEVGPLLTTQWFQKSPYNMYCPSYTMTGCVATAMAQVLKYWNYPAFGKGSHSYSDDSGYGTQSANFGNTRYDWPNMPNRLTNSSSTVQKEAVATLMYHCGVSVNMNYSTIYSGATLVKCEIALPSYFRFNSEDIRYRNKGQISNADWTDTLIAELNLLRPVLHGGSGPAGGHCFVCDGYNAQRYLHFNLGEDGEGDAYYAVGAITYGAYSFNQANDAILGAHPEYGFYTAEETVSFDRNGGVKQVWLSTCDTVNIPWTMTQSADWFTVSGTDFDHLGQITLTAAPNATGQVRIGSVTFSQGNVSASLNVVQEQFAPSDYCPLTVVMENTHSEPWAGDAHLSFESPNGTVYGIAQHTANSSSSTTTVSVAPHDVMMRWHPGGALDRYINYKVMNQHGDVFADVNNAYFDGEDVLIVWPCSHTGIEEHDIASNCVWPNPTSGILNINMDDVVSACLLDATGRLVMVINDKQIDLSKWAAGIYYLRLERNHNIQVEKIVKN